MPPLRFPPDRIGVEDRTVPLPPPPPYPDLAVSSIYLDVNFSARRLCAGAIVRNYGGAAPDRPWRIDISVARGGSLARELQHLWGYSTPNTSVDALPTTSRVPHRRTRDLLAS